MRLTPQSHNQSGIRRRAATYRALRQKLIDANIETVDASSLPRLDLGSGVRLSVLADADTVSLFGSEL